MVRWCVVPPCLDGELRRECGALVRAHAVPRGHARHAELSLDRTSEPVDAEGQHRRRTRVEDAIVTLQDACEHRGDGALARGRGALLSALSSRLHSTLHVVLHDTLFGTLHETLSGTLFRTLRHIGHTCHRPCEDRDELSCATVRGMSRGTRVTTGS